MVALNDTNGWRAVQERDTYGRRTAAESLASSTAQTPRIRSKNRYYSPDLGRFATRDPVGYRGGSYGLYEYTGSSVTFWADPLGMDPCFPRTESDLPNAFWSAWGSQILDVSYQKPLYDYWKKYCPCGVIDFARWASGIRSALGHFAEADARMRKEYYQAQKRQRMRERQAQLEWNLWMYERRGRAWRQGFAESLGMQSESFAGFYGDLFSPSKWHMHYGKSGLGQTEHESGFYKWGTRGSLATATTAAFFTTWMLSAEVVAAYGYAGTSETIASRAAMPFLRNAGSRWFSQMQARWLIRYGPRLGNYAGGTPLLNWLTTFKYATPGGGEVVLNWVKFRVIHAIPF